MKFTISDDEFWYGGSVTDGYRFPLDAQSDFTLDIDANKTYNQLNPIFLSSRGRYLWLEQGGKITFRRGVVTVDAPSAELNADGKTLRDAACNATGKHYPPDGTKPAECAFKAPQCCSWIVLQHGNNQQGVLEYARSFVAGGYKPGVLILDDCWQDDYGVWDFHKGRFPDPKAMLDELRALGFTPMLWLAPFVSADSDPYKELFAAGGLVRVPSGAPYLPEWWNGYSAVLDLRKPSDAAWYKAQCDRLQSEYGPVGFKLDGGDACYYPADGNEQNRLWIDIPDTPLKEARACYKLAGKGIIQRLADKGHCWGVNMITDVCSPDNTFIQYGLSTVVLGILAQGIMGYRFGCPDMVGGGNAVTFGTPDTLDAELIIRWCQASVLMPIVQFSLDVWNMPRDNIAPLCKAALDVREKLLPYILEQVDRAAATGEPIIRYMEYEFPGAGLERVIDQFMLGDRYLVAPVVEQGAVTRTICFPAGRWKDIRTCEEYGGGRCEVPAPLDKLPVYERI